MDIAPLYPRVLGAYLPSPSRSKGSALGLPYCGFASQVLNLRINDCRLHSCRKLLSYTVVRSPDQPTASGPKTFHFDPSVTASPSSLLRALSGLLILHRDSKATERVSSSRQSMRLGLLLPSSRCTIAADAARSSHSITFRTRCSLSLSIRRLTPRCGATSGGQRPCPSYVLSALAAFDKPQRGSLTAGDQKLLPILLAKATGGYVRPHVVLLWFTIELLSWQSICGKGLPLKVRETFSTPYYYGRVKRAFPFHIVIWNCLWQCPICPLGLNCPNQGAFLTP